MARGLSKDARDSLFLVVVVGALLAFVFVGARFAPDGNHPLWRNIYFWLSSGSSGDYSLLSFFAVVANGVNSTTGRPPRMGLASLAFVAGLTGILTATSFAVGVIPRIGLVDCLITAIAGGAFARFLLDGAVVRVWWNLTARNIDYAGRFLPLAGTVLSVGILWLWLSDLAPRWSTRDYTSGVAVACFSLGILCVLISGRRRPPALAVTDERGELVR